MEVPVYAEIPSLAREMLVQQIGTFHDRQGSQGLLNENGVLPAGWSRVWGGHSVQGNDGSVNQKFDGTIGGGQVGQDVYSDTTASGHRNHYGFFLGFARATGDVNGFALAQPDFAAGHLSIDSYSLGGYWTHIGPGGWYTDTVLMLSTMTIDPRSNQNIGATTHGKSVTASVEAGLPIPLPLNLSIEPQVQLIYQHTHINDLDDGVSTVAFHSASSLIGRLGARLQGEFVAAGLQWQPYARVNVLRYFGGTDSVTFTGNTILPTTVGQTEGQVGAGISARVNNTVSVFASAGYLFNLGGAHQRTVEGNAGVRLSW
ncbi:autotransporter domain-containing protein [Paraburkholderia sp. CHISQ3]|uniref:autotransporter domain-containing protein n=1 Tax=Paraburkholderia TaxID=1822464 RepID=UPI0034630762